MTVTQNTRLEKRATNYTQEYSDRCFGGYIYESDFFTNSGKSKNIAARIISDWNFDYMCNMNIMGRNHKKNHEVIDGR